MNKKSKQLAGALALALGLGTGTAIACTPYTFSASPAQGAEGGSLTFHVFRSGDPTATVSVEYGTVGTTATAGADFGSRSGTLTFRKNEVMKSIVVPIYRDVVAEAPETVQLVLSGTGTQPPVTNGVGVIISTAAPSSPPGVGLPGTPGVPAVPDVPRPTLPGIPKPPGPPDPCGSGSYCK